MNRTNTIITSLTLATLVISILLQLTMYVGWDIGWRLHITNELLSGGNYLTSFIDINPPILMYEYVPAILIAKLTSLSAITSLRLTIYVLGLTSLWLCYKVSEHLFPEKNKLLKTGILVIIAIIFFILPAMEFGQREHLTILLTLPYFFNAALLTQRKQVSNAVRFWVGLFAGFGFITNISFFLLFLIIEIYLVVKRKAIFRIDNLCVVSIFILYVISIFILTPNYIRVILPLAAMLYFPTFAYSARTLFFNNTFVSWLVTALLLPFHFRRTTQKSLYLVFFVAASFALIEFSFTRKVSFYQVIPTLSFTFILLIIYLMDDMKNIRYLRSFNLKTESSLLIATIVVYAAILLIPVRDVFVYNRASIHYRTNKTNEINLLVDFVKQVAQGKMIYVFSVSVDPGDTLKNYAHVKLANRILGFWMLPSMLKLLKESLPTKKEAKLQSAKTLLINTVVKDFQKNDPAMVIVQVNNGSTDIRDHNFNYIQFFSKDPRFKKIWSQYHYTYQINDFTIYMK